MSSSFIYELLYPENVRNMLIVTNRKFAISIVATYVLLVKWFLPEIMKNKKPFDLRKVIAGFSFMLSTINAIAANEITQFLVNTWYFRCDVRSMPRNILEAGRLLMYHAYLVRFLELGDTFFYVLRKKNNQVTILHVFHHSFVLIVLMFGLSVDIAAYYTLLALHVNTIVHTIMYFYYGLAAIGPHMRKHLWWKRYLTLVQITQFVYILLYASYGYFTGCEKFTKIDWGLFFFTFAILILFLNFYIKSFRGQNSHKH